MADDVLAVNATQMKTKERVTRSGTRTTTYAVTTTVTSEPMTFMLDEAEVARAAAAAIAKQAREQTKAIAEIVTPATANARTNIERAYARGEGWAVSRYTGGRTGSTPPKSGERRKYNHSGRLANGIVSTFRKDQKDFAINYPANRWNPKDWRSRGDMEIAFQRWIDHAPVLARPKDDIVVKKALTDTHAAVVQKARMGATHKEALRTGKVIVQVIQALERALA